VRIYRTALDAELAAVLASGETVSRIAQIPAAERNAAQVAKLRLTFLERYAPDEMKSAWSSLLDLRGARQRLMDSFPTVMVMQDSATRRETHVLNRGAYDRPAEKVEPGVPAVLPPLPAGAPNNRLGFAQWLVDRSNPLTARVAVNRFWQMYFGVGLVKTVEDFDRKASGRRTRSCWTGWPRSLWTADGTSRLYNEPSSPAQPTGSRPPRHPRCCARMRRTVCWHADRACGSPRI
jgi:hypothetical protein